MSDQAGTAHQTLGLITRRPFVPVAILFTLGILGHAAIPIHPECLITVIVGLLMAAAACLRRRFVCSTLIATAIFTSGITAGRVEHFQYQSNDIGLFATDEPHLTQLELYLPDEPQLSASAPGQRVVPPRQIVTAEVRRIKTWAGWIAATGRLPVEIDQINPALNAGQTIRAIGMLQRPRAAFNPGEFDWSVYYRQQRILATFNVTRGENFKILIDPGASPLGWLRSKSRHLLASGFSQSHATDQALLTELLLGDHDPLLRDITQEFQVTGVGYQLSVSGLHITIVAWPVFWLCRWMRLRPRWSLLICITFVLMYGAVSEPSHSGMRSIIISGLIGAAYFSGRFVDRAQLLAIGATAMLLWHPMDLFSVGFHLSFAVVTVFVLALPPLRDWEWQNRDRDKAAARQKPTTFQAIASTIYSWLFRSLYYSLLAWVATLPLVAYHFGQLSPWGVCGGVAMLPVVALALDVGALKILFTLLWPVAAGWWAVPAAWPVEWLQWSVHQLSRLPGGTVPLLVPPVWLIVVYYLLLLVPLLPQWRWFEGRRRWILRLTPFLGVALILWPSSPSSQATLTPVGDFRITLLSLGAGQCAVVEIPGEHAILFDAGSTTVPDLTKRIIGPFLRFENEQAVDDIFLSHGDFDHISAAGEIAGTYQVRHIFTSYHFRRNAEGNLPDQILLDQLANLDLSPQQIAVGDHFDLGSGAAVDCLWPPKIGELNSNNAGLVLRLTYAGRSILLPADIQDPAFHGLLEQPAVLKSDVLVAPHHGSSEDLTPEFLGAVRPDAIISSNAWRLTNKQKRFDKMVGATPLYRTSECGAITVTITRDGKIAISTFIKKTNRG